MLPLGERRREAVVRANSALVAPGRRGPGTLLRRGARSEGGKDEPDCQSGRDLIDSWRVRPDCLGPWTHAQARGFGYRIEERRPRRLLRRRARSEGGRIEPDCLSGRGLIDSWWVRPDCLGPWTHAQARGFGYRVEGRRPRRLLRRRARSEGGRIEPDCLSGRGLIDSWRVRPDYLGPWTHAQARGLGYRVEGRESSTGC
jgi:hypothetical protein